VSDTESVKFGIVAACPHPQINYSKVNYSHAAFATAPAQVISYCECHDNNTLWDKLKLSAPEASAAERENMQLLALTIVLTSQGIPFLYEGTELLHSKRGIDNSFNSGDSINAIRWSGEKERLREIGYLALLIRMRQTHRAFRMTTAAQIAANIHFEVAPKGCIIYSINGAAVKDSWSKIWIAFNGTGSAQKLSVPSGLHAFQGGAANKFGPFEDGYVDLPGYGAAIYYR